MVPSDTPYSHHFLSLEKLLSKYMRNINIIHYQATAHHSFCHQASFNIGFMGSVHRLFSLLKLLHVPRKVLFQILSLHALFNWRFWLKIQLELVYKHTISDTSSYQDLGPAFLQKNSETRHLNVPQEGENLLHLSQHHRFSGAKLTNCDFYSLMKKQSTSSIRNAGSQRVYWEYS